MSPRLVKDFESRLRPNWRGWFSDLIPLHALFRNSWPTKEQFQEAFQKKLKIVCYPLGRKEHRSTHEYLAKHRLLDAVLSEQLVSDLYLWSEVYALGVAHQEFRSKKGYMGYSVTTHSKLLNELFRHKREILKILKSQPILKDWATGYLRSVERQIDEEAHVVSDGTALNLRRRRWLKNVSSSTFFRRQIYNAFKEFLPKRMGSLPDALLFHLAAIVCSSHVGKNTLEINPRNIQKQMRKK